MEMYKTKTKCKLAGGSGINASWANRRASKSRHDGGVCTFVAFGSL